MADPTQDPNAAPMGQAAPGQPQAPQQPQEAGFTILIHCDADQKLTVGVESDAQESAEAGAAGMAPGAEEPGQMSPATDIKDALTQALTIFKAGGKPDATAEHARQLTSQGFTAGYEQDN